MLRQHIRFATHCEIWASHYAREQHLPSGITFGMTDVRTPGLRPLFLSKEYLTSWTTRWQSIVTAPSGIHVPSTNARYPFPFRQYRELILGKP